MAVIFFGTRPFGRIDEYGGEYATTAFFHVYFLPLVPRQSLWVVDHGDIPDEQPIRMSARSVVVGYARIWGPIVALATLLATNVSPSPISAIAIAVAAALGAWSWLATGLRGETARRRSDFNRVAFGTRCDPSRLSAEQREALQRSLEQQWAPDVNPEDIARYGTTDPQVAATAYGMLRLAGIARGREGAAERAHADRIVDGAAEAPPGGGPYRGLALGGDAGATVREIAKLAAPSPLLMDSLRRQRHARFLIGLGVITLIGIGNAVSLARSGFGRPLVLSGARGAPLNRSAVVECEWTQTVGHRTNLFGAVVGRYQLCHAGPMAVLLVVPPVETDSLTFRGVTARVTDELFLRDDLDDDNWTLLDVALDATREPDRSRVAFNLLSIGAMVVAWIAYVAWRRRNPPV